MKYVILVGDGMADEPLEELGGRTPLEHAHTPHMDALARRAALMGLVRTVPEGMEPGSDVANMAILGYDPREHFTGRAPIEAAAMGIELGPDDVAIRCNLVTLEEQDGRLVMADHSAGHLPTPEAHALIARLKPVLEREGPFELHPGVSYRNLLVWRGGFSALRGVKLTPPHNILDQPVDAYWPQPPESEGARTLLQLMQKARQFLLSTQHEHNTQANAIWLWGAGQKPKLIPLKARFGIAGAVISAVDLIKGLGALAGLRVLRVPGATGYLDTNYEGKVEYALDALKQGDDLVYVHVEAPDEVSHEGSLAKKRQAIEDFDARVVGPLVEGLQRFERWALLLLPDHPTPLKKRVHTPDPIPFALVRSWEAKESSQVQGFGERAARKTGVVVEEGYTLIERLLGARA